MAGEGPAGITTGRFLTVDAHPYPWPWDRGFSADRIALVLCGAQRFFAERTQRADEVLLGLAALAASLRDAGALVVHLQHDGSFASLAGRPPFAPARGSDGSILPVCVADGDLVIDCHGLDGFCSSSLELRLHLAGRDLIVLAGLGLEGPVHSTMRSANDRGFECLLLTDASAKYDDVLAASVIHSTTMSGGIFGAVATTASLLEALRAVDLG